MLDRKTMKSRPNVANVVPVFPLVTRRRKDVSITHVGRCSVRNTALK